MAFPIFLLVQSPLISWDLRSTPDAKVRSRCSLRRAGGDLYHLWTAGDSGAMATGSQELRFLMMEFAHGQWLVMVNHG